MLRSHFKETIVGDTGPIRIRPGREGWVSMAGVVVSENAQWIVSQRAYRRLIRQACLSIEDDAALIGELTEYEALGMILLDSLPRERALPVARSLLTAAIILIADHDPATKAHYVDLRMILEGFVQ
jgi:hypothetical protein